MPAVVEGVSLEFIAELLSNPPSDAGDEPQQDVVNVGNIPKELWEPEATNIVNFLSEQLAEAESERSDFIDKLVRWKEAYKAPLPERPKNFPIHNASNLTVPVIKETVNTLAAQLVQSTLTARPRWVMKDLAKEWEPFVDEVEDFLDIAQERDFDLEGEAIEWIIESAKLGTSIMEVAYKVDERRIYKYTPDGSRTYPSNIIHHDGPVLKKTPLQRFWIRFHEKSIQSARWVSKEFEINEVELVERENNKKFENVDRVRMWLFNQAHTDDKVQEAEEEWEKTEPSSRETVNVHEIYLSWDIDGDGKFEELRIYFHRDSRTVLRAEFLPFWHGKRPFIKLGYFPVDDRFYDEGLCEMLEQIQKGISEMSNRRSDNAALANMAMILKRKMVKGLMPGDPLYSTKVIEVNDIHNDIREFRLSEIYPSTISEEQILRQYAERLAGTNEGIAGAAMPVSRTTASAQLALLQEQAKRIDLAVRNIRKGLNNVGVFVINLYFQYGVNEKAVAWMGERGLAVQGIFRLPRRVAEIGFALKASTPTSVQNRQVIRENKLQLFNLLVQAHEQLLPLVANLAPQKIPEVAHALVAASRKYLGDVLETFDETDPEGVLAGLATLERVLPRPEDLGGLEAFERGARESEILTQLSRLESLVKQAEASSRGREGLGPERGERERVSAPEGLPRGLDASILPGREPGSNGR